MGKIPVIYSAVTGEIEHTCGWSGVRFDRHDHKRNLLLFATPVTWGVSRRHQT